MMKGLFRGKNKNNEWVYGDLCHYSNNTGYFIQPPMELATLGVEVKAETAEQYIGLEDRNGNKIFEGDIVVINFRQDKIGVVWWDRSTARYVIIHDSGFTDFINMGSHKLEVIGNIHDSEEKSEDC